MLASAMLLHVQAQQTKEVKPRAVLPSDVQISCLCKQLLQSFVKAQRCMATARKVNL